MILVIDIGNTTIAFTGLTGMPGDERDFQVLFEEKLPTDTGRDRNRFLQEAETLCRRHGIRINSRNSQNERPELSPDAADPGQPDRHEEVRHEKVNGIGTAGRLREPQSPQTTGAGCLVTLTAISSVVPDCTPAAQEFAMQLCGTSPVFIDCHCDCGLTFGRIPNPEKLGADRIADAAWAAATVQLPAMTVDLGTATTINVISRTGEFLGGMIGAGVRTCLQALRSGTAQLPALDPRAVPTEQLIGTDTAQCMRSAAVAGTACMIDGLAARVEEQLGQPLSLILTGGNAAFAAPWVRHPFTLEPALAAKGAALIARRARSDES